MRVKDAAPGATDSKQRTADSGTGFVMCSRGTFCAAGESRRKHFDMGGGEGSPPYAFEEKLRISHAMRFWMNAWEGSPAYAFEEKLRISHAMRF